MSRVLVVLAVIISYKAGLSLRAHLEDSSSELTKIVPTDIPNQSVKANAEDYSIILSRNIFGKTQAASSTLPSPKAASNLKLRLVGTSVTPGKTPFAIIEDSGKRKQDVFEIGESVFGNAKLVEITPESVSLEHEGRLEVLEIEGGARLAARTTDDASASIPSPDQTEFDIQESELQSALADLPQLLSQARAVPYYRGGESIGMRLFAIRQGSLYEKLGLRNGDVVLSVNDNSLSDPSQALRIFEELKQERHIIVQVERDGQPKELQYSIR